MSSFPSPAARVAALLSVLAGKLIRRCPAVETAVHHGAGGFVFLAKHGSVSPDVLRGLLPGVRPGLAPPDGDELRFLTALAGGPLTGAELAARLDMAADGGAFQKRVSGLQERGFVWNPGKGYRLTEYGAWVLQKEG